MKDKTSKNTINIHFKKSYINRHWYGLIGLMVGGLLFGFSSNFLAPFHDLSDPLALFFFIYLLLIFFIIAGFMASRLRFVSTGSPALILTDQGIKDQSSLISKGFFIPYRDIVGAKGVLATRYGYTDIVTGDAEYLGFKKRYKYWRRLSRTNGMLVTQGICCYSIHLRLADRGKYVPKIKNPLIRDAKGLIYNIYCGPLDIPITELLRLIEERVPKHFSMQGKNRKL